MKKLTAITLTLLLLITMLCPVYAADETKIEVPKIKITTVSGIGNHIGFPTVFICKPRLRSILIWSGIEVYFFINLYSRPTLCPVPCALYP